MANKMKNFFLALIMLFFTHLSFGENIIINGTFDNNTTGWSGEYFIAPGVNSTSSSTTINTGTYYYAGNENSTGDESRISQIYNLKTSDLSNLSSVADFQFDTSADLFGYRHQNDKSIFSVYFFSEPDAQGEILDSIVLDSEKDRPANNWPDALVAGRSPNFQSIRDSVPKSTQSILFTIESVRTDGIQNDGYADNLCFSFITQENDSCVSNTLSQSSFAEPSDTPEQAIPILVNDGSQYHLLDDKGDQDWFEFYAEQGTRYTIILPQESLGSAIDPIITLFDEAGTELETINSSPLGQEEVLNWTATATALFRIRVTNGTTTRAKERPAASEYAYTINVFLSDALQQGIIKGSVVDSCQQLGLGKVVITAALSGQITESTFTHKTGEYGIPINPGDYDLNTQIVNYQDSQKNVTVQQVTASQAPFSLAPVADCSQIPVRVTDPTLQAQQAVANYNDQTGILIIKDVLADGRNYYAELQDQGGYHFSLIDAIELPGSVHSGSADYSFETLLVNIPEVFAFNTLYKVQMKNDGGFLFSLVDASTP